MTPLEEFRDAYRDALRALAPAEVRGSPCFGWGRGGVAYALLYEARVTGDRSQLELASRWARAGIRTASTFAMRGWPKLSYSRGLSGLYAIEARIAHARGDAAGARRAIDRFVAAQSRARGCEDLFQGAAGRLAGAAALLRETGDARVKAAGEALLARVARMQVADPFGLAHGQPGVVFGMLAWECVAPTLADREVDAAVRALARYDGTDFALAHGQAGYALVYLRAFQRLGDAKWRGLALAAAARAHREASHFGHRIYDGATGVAYLLLAIADIADASWRDRAHALALATLRAMSIPEQDTYGMWSGLSGLYCLVLELLTPTADVGVPGFER